MATIKIRQGKYGNLVYLSEVRVLARREKGRGKYLSRCDDDTDTIVQF